MFADFLLGFTSIEIESLIDWSEPIFQKDQIDFG